MERRVYRLYDRETSLFPVEPKHRLGRTGQDDRLISSAVTRGLEHTGIYSKPLL